MKQLMRLFLGLAAMPVLALLASSLSPAISQEAASRIQGLALSNDQPIQIESDKLEIKEELGQAVFTGNVKVVQGDTLLQSGIMTVYYATKGNATGSSVASGASEIEKIEVANKVLLKSGTQTATSDTGTFNMVSEVLVLAGKNVVLTEGANVFTGCKLTVQMKSGQAQLDRCANQRVLIQLDPKSRPQQ